MDAAAATSEAADKAARASEEAAHAEATVEIAARNLDSAKAQRAPKRTLVDLEAALHAALDRAEAAEAKAERAAKAVERLREELDLSAEPAPEPQATTWQRVKAWALREDDDNG